MHVYIAKRIALFVPTLILVTILLFVLLRLIPGDPALLILLGPEGDNSVTQEELDALREKLGTNRPLYVEYGHWVWRMLQLDFRGVLFL